MRKFFFLTIFLFYFQAEAKEKDNKSYKYFYSINLGYNTIENNYFASFYKMKSKYYEQDDSELGSDFRIEIYDAENRIQFEKSTNFIESEKLELARLKKHGYRLSQMSELKNKFEYSLNFKSDKELVLLRLFRKGIFVKETKVEFIR